MGTKPSSLKCMKTVRRSQHNRSDKSTRAKILPLIPKWMECTWRRVPCGKITCKVCRHTLSHAHAGQETENFEAAMEDVGYHLKSALDMLRKEAERLGIEMNNLHTIIATPPKPTKFSLYRTIKQWRDAVFDLEMDAENAGSWWLYTESAADLFWYANMITTKVYRQLCNRWHMKKENNYGKLDYQYTNYVLNECLAITKFSLRELSLMQSEQKGELMLALTSLAKLEENIKKI